MSLLSEALARATKARKHHHMVDCDVLVSSLDRHEVKFSPQERQRMAENGGGKR